jgi:hypothetical protein
VQNYAEPGFQFERLVTGGQLDGHHELMHHESMQLMRIGAFNVLFSADVDAVDAAGRVVEIKSGNPRYFGSKVAATSATLATRGVDRLMVCGRSCFRCCRRARRH